ncbi:PREDICTED: COMM domain-containing protein 2-like [Priapulus caudatus]|uniref:COMM domain-containing protein 2-like n=1 Tax=Priapulus caudatus TaxID=37621 RepID=A0ABM1E110_PRICU|nr:PREDICTED: COMM domain-containing protein 2-like [Priapulus caudatus]XP_014665882.1 PREDICTED: COMM domain-containing protein 2-like [Priapulus caudatus]XP_014665883.1 PREDICTED: COMM domain-containing protein 2-like [Priapulus caudatus]XP_014665884.1 PREDICTED: COMM domain-containing protein 2-like [Priapulus caudatus]
MLLVLEDSHKQHLGWLSKLDLEVVNEFIRMCVEFITKGATTNQRSYQVAAQRLGVTPDTVRSAISALVHLLTTSSKLALTQLDFTDSVLALGFSSEASTALLAVYRDRGGELRRLLTTLGIDLPHYCNLTWRADVQVASRTLYRQLEPILLVKLHLGQCGEQNALLQTDLTTLVHLTNTLERALDEIKTPHCRRIIRHIK